MVPEVIQCQALYPALGFVVEVADTDIENRESAQSTFIAVSI